MRRMTAGLLCLALLLCLPACSSGEKTVPDQTVDWFVQDLLAENAPQGYTDTAYEVTHSPDAATHTDTVTVELTVTYPHCTGVTSCEATYQYDKSSDLWSVIRGGEWEPMTAKDYTSIPSDPDEWAVILEQLDSGIHVDFECTGQEGGHAVVMEMDGEEFLDEVQTGWLIEAWSSSNSFVFDGLIYFVSFKNNETAADFYEHACSQITNDRNTAPSKNTETDNVLYSRYHFPEESIDVFSVDQSVLIIYTETDGTEVSVDKLLSNVGFLPPV